MVEEEKREIKVSIWAKRYLCIAHRCLLNKFGICPKNLEWDIYQCDDNHYKLIITKIQRNLLIPINSTKKEEQKFRQEYRIKYGLSPEEENERVNGKIYRKKCCENPQWKNKSNIRNKLDLIFDVPHISNICEKFLFKIDWVDKNKKE